MELYAFLSYTLLYYFCRRFYASYISHCFFYISILHFYITLNIYALRFLQCIRARFYAMMV